jgi:hypothetical protein
MNLKKVIEVIKRERKAVIIGGTIATITIATILTLTTRHKRK